MKKMIKIVCLLATTSLLAATPIYATQKSNKSAEKTQAVTVTDITKMVDDSIAKTKKLLPYLDDYPHKTVTIDESGDNTVRVLLKKNEDEEKILPNVVLWLDKKTGELKRFRLLNDANTDESLAKGETAVEQATAFLKQWYGEDMRGYRYNPYLSHTIGVPFSKVMNGLFYPSQSLRITVDSAGRITEGGQAPVPDSNFNYPVPEIEETRFDDPKDAIPVEEMETLVASMMTLSHDGDTFIYQPMFSGYIDAKTGKGLEIRQANYETPGPIVHVKPSGATFSVKTKEDAASYLKKERGIQATAADIREEAARDETKKRFWWKEGTEQEALVQADAATGEVVAYFTIDTEQNETKSVTREQARLLAIKEVEKYLPSGTTELMEIVNHRSENWRGNMFTFAPLHQGIPNLSHAFTVNIHGFQVTDFFGATKAKLAAKPTEGAKVVSAEQAAKAFLKENPLQLIYFYPKDNGKQAVLTYQAKQGYSLTKINAVTGKIIEPKNE
ncbi:YcdB/YcdC domain-containing protein [Brevibacillus reuszeri]|uniref:YcdB/YcdC domain-containing protein n=1 Tax=Brevibacillus reuszeri TaxID=54915 RepID=UPI0028A21200|nr:YcdB/YcdC domain-containing protein [Brevibacillus reuszeri]